MSLILKDAEVEYIIYKDNTCYFRLLDSNYINKLEDIISTSARPWYRDRWDNFIIKINFTNLGISTPHQLTRRNTYLFDLSVNQFKHGYYIKKF